MPSAVSKPPERQIQDLTDEEIDFMRSESKSDLFFFARTVLGLNFLEPQLHEPVCRFLQANPKRAIVILPRSFLKTSLTRAYLIWRVIHNPNMRILYVTNSEPNAKKFLHAIKDVFERNLLFSILFPEVIPDFSHARWSDLAAEVQRDAVGFPEATFEAAGVGSAVVSRHYDLIVEDDTLAPKKDDVSGEELLPMQEEIDKVIGWHKLATPLLVDARQSEILVVGTRWTYADLIHHIQSQKKQGTALDYQVFERACRELDDKGEPTGPPTHPKRFPDDVLKGVEAELGPYLFGALYNNRPVSGDKQIFKPRWIKDNMYTTPPPVSQMRKFAALDAAYSLEGTADYTGIVVAGITDDAHLYVLDYVKARMQPKEIIEALFTLLKAHPEIEMVRVEAVAAQVAMIYDIEDKMFETNTFFTLDPVKSRLRTKDMRIGRLQPLASNGRLHLKETHTELYQELVTFPFGRHDDLVDALSDMVPCIGLPSTVGVEELPLESRRWKPDVETGRYGLGIDEIMEEIRERDHDSLYDVQLASPDNETNWISVRTG